MTLDVYRLHTFIVTLLDLTDDIGRCGHHLGHCVYVHINDAIVQIQYGSNMILNTHDASDIKIN